MSRTWKATPPRPNLTRKQRAAIFMKTDGRCYLCQQKLLGDWDAEHPLSRELGGSDDIDALMPCCIPCHKPKTADDNRMIKKALRVRDRHIGAKQSATPMPLGRKSAMKRRMDGTVVWRDTGEPVK